MQNWHVVYLGYVELAYTVFAHFEILDVHAERLSTAYSRVRFSLFQQNCQIQQVCEHRAAAADNDKRPLLPTPLNWQQQQHIQQKQQQQTLKYRNKLSGYFFIFLTLYLVLFPRSADFAAVTGAGAGALSFPFSFHLPVIKRGAA